MANDLAKEYIEGGMGASIALREELESRFKRALEGGEINHGEYNLLIIAAGNWDMQGIIRLLRDLSCRGIEMEDLTIFLASYTLDETNLRQSACKTVEFLLDITNPEFVVHIEEMNIPPEITHIFKVIGWNRIGFSLERLEAALVSRARMLKKKQKKEGK
jgi:hypothetical protein